MFSSSRLPPGVNFRVFLRQLNVVLAATFPMDVNLSQLWLCAAAGVHFGLHLLLLETTLDAIYCCKFLDICTDLRNNSFLYTDGSRSDGGVGCAFIIGSDDFCYWFPEHSSDSVPFKACLCCTYRIYSNLSCTFFPVFVIQKTACGLESSAKQAEVLKNVGRCRHN
ncbi:uncharacterized protein LOC126253070 [Schistocerca nitens]|uniref:uncharacterized protein LOC126253070 n=1 Tax=Schistocerca nitens TaxID=7011 RepID=UPI0021172D13|nr:uncharacterized protein LOC126253070 [Schistocerca nitens]